jgi:hypothetical protein
MKFLVYPFSLVLVILLACSEEHDTVVLSDCMKQKIEDFKSQPTALTVIQIDAPAGKVYWFRLDGIVPDVGEDVFTSDCELYCNFGCFCDPSTYCDEDLLNFPRETIWSK